MLNVTNGIFEIFLNDNSTSTLKMIKAKTKKYDRRKFLNKGISGTIITEILEFS